MLFIPEKIKVGFTEREDTFDGKLSYIIYYDEKGKLRKEKSWSEWRDEKITALEINNTPFKNLSLNKSIQRDAYYFGSGRNMIRIYDSRGFEYEITTDNLLGIMNYNDVIKNELQGEYIYAFDSGELILLPTNSEQYKEAKKMTESIKTKVKRKDLVIGNTYLARNGKKCIYIGKYNINKPLNENTYYEYKNIVINSNGKKDIFFIPEENIYKDVNINTLGLLEGNISEEHLEEILSNYVGTYLEKEFESFDFSHEIKFSNNDEFILLGKKINNRTSMLIEYRGPIIEEIINHKYDMENNTHCTINTGKYRVHNISFSKKIIELNADNKYEIEYSHDRNFYELPGDSLIYKRINEIDKKIRVVFDTKEEAEKYIKGVNEDIKKEWKKNHIGLFYIKYKDGTENRVFSNY